MMFARIKPFVVYAVLFFLVLSGFYIRINNYRKSTTRTIDELVFYHLGAQLKNHFPEYHARGFSNLLLEIHPEFAPLPEYLTQPLFKHPPLFSALISLALRLFGEHYYSAMYVSAFFGVMMIFLAYWIGTLSFDETTGLAAAFLVWLDPVNIISAENLDGYDR
jgi:asparagine N-glycosylation enzyme membrane subunit Stt3